MNIDEIRSRMIRIVESETYRPMARTDLAHEMGIPADDRREFYGFLTRFENEGVISISKNKKVSPPGRSAGSGARMLSLTKTGGFAALDDGSGDVFIPKSRLAGAMPTDLVNLRIFSRTGRLPEAEVLRVTQRNFSEFTGTLMKRGKNAYVLPDSGIREKIPVAHKDALSVHDKDKVFARIKTYPGKNDPGSAVIITSYGPAQGAAACCSAVLDRLHIRRDFPPAVLAEAKAKTLAAGDADGRLDLRGEIIFTIDGAHSKDLDDAVSVEKTPSGYLLGVHIADVSQYVTPGSQLDEEAFERGTSIYFADTVIPMLPKELSNGICSLNPNEDRLAFSALMEIDEAGQVTGSRFAKSVIRSRVKGVYDEINHLFDETAGEELREKYHEVLPKLAVMRPLAGILTAARKKRGALDFDSDDCEIILDEEGVAEAVERRVRGESEQMIEEFMLCANEAVARFASTQQAPLVYRVHEEPDGQKLETLSAALRMAGIDARGIRPGLKPLDVAKTLEKIAESPKVRALSDMVLRSMAKARYAPECLGHFGLALQYYCHFTSPIRRYPDLVVHRILAELLDTGAGEGLKKKYTAFAAKASEQSSAREITAMQVEWDCDEIYKAEYMSRHIGETFEGRVSSVKSFGMYVELDNTVEGMVRIEKLPGGWYDYDEATLSLVCRKNGARFSVGDSVRVIAARADVSNGQIDFEPI